MKKLLFPALVAALLLPAAATAQETGTACLQVNDKLFQPVVLISGYKDTMNSKAFYLKKSKTQRTIGWSMLGGGVAMVVVGGGLFVNNFELFSRKNDDEAGAGAVLFLCGVGCSLGSIPFFISAAHNSKNAARVSMGGRQIFIPEQNNFSSKMQPSITITIKL
jgi:hypothetical protein